MDNFTNKKYDKAFKWACENWNSLIIKANCKHKPCISCAEQIAQACNIDYKIACDIANSISISIAIGLK
jgi:hypothetical protein